ncbi:class I adenylate-forming enzyme family protein [Streptacidiphilus sp. EB129]|uniref:class I adenylate-forming enzyme family protein n=1 Tax=Streptacidiphilus sp. EB129 TaxID=3156262 RepID=UPI00351824E4
MTLLPPGMPRRINYPPCSVGDILAGTARRHPDRVALWDGEEALDYAELYRRALRLARGLRERGIGPGEVVALHLPNSLWFTVGYYGVLLSGAVVTPINPALPPAVLAEQLTEAGAVAAISHPATLAALAAAAVPLRLVVTVPATEAAPAGAAPPETAPDTTAPDRTPSGDLAERAVRVERLLAGPAPAALEPVSPEALAHLSFTGGTTGRSKAVRVLHRQVVANSLQMGCWRSASLPHLDDRGGLYLDHVPGAIRPDTVRIAEGSLLAVAPMFHAMGLVTQNLCTAGAVTVVVAGRFEPGRYLAQLQRHRVSTLAGSPALFHALLAVPGIERADLSSVRLVSSGAAPMDSATLARLGELMPEAAVTEGYGLTECTMGLTSHPPLLDGTAPLGSVGVPVFDTEIEIRDLVDAKPLPTGEVGEVWARGPQVADGYHGHPELTGQQFQDGWLRTGDLGRTDPDGWLFLVGRAKDMLLYKGYNVYPGPLEELLHRHPAVALAAVVGEPDPEAGEIPVAHVVPRPGHPPTEGLAGELIAFVARQVAPYQRVRVIRFAESLPVSAAGKVLKTELRRGKPESDGSA